MIPVHCPYCLRSLLHVRVRDARRHVDSCRVLFATLPVAMLERLFEHTGRQP